jgi:hypothetical protein
MGAGQVVTIYVLDDYCSSFRSRVNSMQTYRLLFHWIFCRHSTNTLILALTIVKNEVFANQDYGELKQDELARILLH